MLRKSSHLFILVTVTYKSNSSVFSSNDCLSFLRLWKILGIILGGLMKDMGMKRFLFMFQIKFPLKFLLMKEE